MKPLKKMVEPLVLSVWPRGLEMQFEFRYSIRWKNHIAIQVMEPMVPEWAQNLSLLICPQLANIRGVNRWWIG